MKNMLFAFTTTITCFALACSSANASIVFQDTFDTDGGLTANSPNIGNDWGGSGSFAAVGGFLDMNTGSQTNNNVNFTALGAGEVLTATIEVTALNSTDAWGGVSLFAGANASGGEIGITGQGDSWGVDVSSSAGGAAPGGNSAGGNVRSGITTAGTITFVYDFDSGDYTWTGPGGGAFETGDGEDANANLALQSIRIADANAGADFTVDSITIDISPSAIPEPSSLMLLGLGCLGMATRRRK